MQMQTDAKRQCKRMYQIMYSLFQLFVCADDGQRMAFTQLQTPGRGPRNANVTVCMASGTLYLIYRDCAACRKRIAYNEAKHRGKCINGLPA